LFEEGTLTDRIKSAEHLLDGIREFLSNGQVHRATLTVILGGFYTGYEEQAKDLLENSADIEEALLAMEIRTTLQQLLKLECAHVHLVMSKFEPPAFLWERAEMECLYSLAAIVAAFDPLSVVEAKRSMNTSAAFVGATFDSLMLNFFASDERNAPEF
jgi:hypothetical protein